MFQQQKALLSRVDVARDRGETNQRSVAIATVECETKLLCRGVEEGK